jgi:succinoglycan biosynthesis protein ExoA
VLGLILSFGLFLSPATCHLPPTTYHLLPTTYHLSPTTYHLSAILPLTYLIANLSASLYTILRPPSPISHPLTTFFLLPLVYLILHLSYGLGFLIGLFKFWNRWGDKQGKVPKMNQNT